MNDKLVIIFIRDAPIIGIGGLLFTMYYDGTGYWKYNFFKIWTDNTHFLLIVMHANSANML